MIYLTEEEIEAYCGLAAGVTMEHVEAASVLIDAYKGISFGPTEHTERVDLTYRRRTEENRGKLVHYPRISIESVKGKAFGIFGTSELDFGIDSLEFDGEDSPYFSFYVPRRMMFTSVPKYITVKYTSGYEVIPEDIKRVCGIIACNIKQMGGILRWKSRDDYDIKVTLGNDGVMSEEVKRIIDGVQVR